ncbi:MAG TPA: hypothetical protein VGR60_00125 [Gemmatimonadales bacterium]|nr:hypothetical protein [Gemmatimonadales bacterium]
MISAETSGPPSAPTAPGGLPAALASALRNEGIDFSQPDPLAFQARKRWGMAFDRSSIDPWAYASRATLRIESTTTGLRVVQTADSVTTLLLIAAGAGLLTLAGMSWEVVAAFASINCVLVDTLGRAGMQKWLRDVVRRGDRA